MVTHTINYEGLELTVTGTYEEPEKETGYKGGWSTDEIKIGDIEVSSMFHDWVCEQIADQVLNENY
jgi:hypothetical protein